MSGHLNQLFRVGVFNPRHVADNRLLMCLGRVDYGCFSVDDGTTKRIPQQGVLAGDSLVVKNFRQSFARPSQNLKADPHYSHRSQLLMVRATDEDAVEYEFDVRQNIGGIDEVTIFAVFASGQTLEERRKSLGTAAAAIYARLYANSEGNDQSFSGVTIDELPEFSDECRDKRDSHLDTNSINTDFLEFRFGVTGTSHALDHSIETTAVPLELCLDEHTGYSGNGEQSRVVP